MQVTEHREVLPHALDDLGRGRDRYLGLVEDDDLLPRLAVVDVSVVVVTHESAQFIEACLASLDALEDRARLEVVVVDNASTDGTPELVAERHPHVRLIRKRSRHGFATNVNIGAVTAAGRHVLLLNPDTQVPSGVIDTLCAHLDRRADVGAVGPRLVYPDGTDQSSARAFPTPAVALVRRTPLRRFLPKLADGHLRGAGLGVEAEDVDWMLGAALLVRRSALLDVGGLDDGYRLYCEDIDLCWRLHAAGWRVQHLGDVVVEHALGELTRKRFFTVRTLWHYRSMLRFVRRNGLVPPRRAS